MTRATDPRGAAAPNCTPGDQRFSTEFRYDLHDRTTRVSTSMDTGRFVARSYTYDPNDNLTALRDRTVRDWNMNYTAMDQVLEERSPSVAHVEGGGEEVTRNTYDSEDNLVKTESPRGTRTPTVDDFTTRYSYDAVNELVVEHRLGTDAAATSYAYDRRGNVVGVVDPNHNLPNDDFVANAQLDTKRRLKFVYDNGDRRSKVIEDPGGLPLTTEFRYDVNDNLVAVTDPRGTATPTVDDDFTAKREYDGQDLLTASVDALGRRTEIARRQDGSIDKVTRPKGTASAFSGDYETRFSYEPTGELKSRTIPFDERQYGSKTLNVVYARNAVGDPETITDPRGKQITNTFLDTGELKTTTRPSWWVADAGGVRERSQDEMAQMPSPPELPQSEGEGDFGAVGRQPTELLPRAGTTTFGHDDEGRLTTVTDTANKTVTFARDETGRVTSLQRPIDATRTMSTSYGYDFNGNVSTINVADGESTTLNRDELDRVSSYAVDLFQQGELRYDRNGNVTQLLSNAGDWDWTYDPLDRRLTETNGAREQTAWTYDGAGNPTVETSPRGMEPGVVNRAPFQTTRDFNAGNELTKLKNGLGHEWRFEYDRNGNQVKVDAPGSARGEGLAEHRQVTERTYDGRDLIWTETAGASDNGPDDQVRTRVFEFDPNGMLRRVVRPAGVNPATRLPNFTYTTDTQVTTDDASRNATVYEYGSTNPNLQTGTRLAWNDDDGTKRYRQNFGYDTRGRLNSIDPPYDAAGSPPAAARTTYTHFDTGWVKTATDWQTLTYDYDRRGQQTLWRSSKGRETTRTYWPSGMPKTRVATAGSTVRSYSYEQRPGYLVSKMVDNDLNRETTFTYDGMGRTMRVDEAAFDVNEQSRRGKDTKIAYDADGNVKERQTDGRFLTDGSYSGGKLSKYTYDTVDQEIEALVTAPGEATRRTVTDYWPSGERKLLTTKRSTAADDTVERTFFFSDGRASRKDRKRVGAAGFAKAQDYKYGINGNRIQDERGSYTFNAREQVTRWTSPTNVITDYELNGSGTILSQTTGGQTVSYAYKPDGERLDAVVDAGGTTKYCYNDATGFGEITGYGPDCQAPVAKFEYDPFGRMRKFTQGGNDTLYTFDGLDRRDTKIDGGRTFDLSYVGIGEALSQEQEFGGQAEVRAYDYTGNDLERLGMARKTSPTGTVPYRAYMTDAAGSVEGLEDDQGNVVGGAYSYDPYGAQLDEGSLTGDAKANPFRFEGHYYDAESKVYDMRARAYFPKIARFLGEDRYEDPIGDQALETEALTQDRYAFAGGNPVDNVEFDGHRVCNGAHDCGGSSREASRRNSNFENQKSVVSPSEQIAWNRAVNEGAREARGRSQRSRKVAAIAPLRPGYLLPDCTPGECEPDEGNSILGFLSASVDAAAGVTSGAAGEVAAQAGGLWDTASQCNVITNSSLEASAHGCSAPPSPRELERHYLRGDPFEATGRLLVGLGGIFLTRRPTPGAARAESDVGAALAVRPKLKPSRHYLQDRKIERNLRTADVFDAYKNPLAVGPARYDAFGRPSMLFQGRNAQVAVNPQTGEIVTAFPTGSRLRRQLLRRAGEVP
jgi:RHS repeat-associated protein